MDDIRLRCFTKRSANLSIASLRPKQARKTYRDISVEQAALEIAAAVREKGQPIAGETLRGTLEINRILMRDAITLGRARRWVSVKVGPAGGLVAGTVDPPASEKATSELLVQRSEKIARYVRDNDQPVSAKRLMDAFGLSLSAVRTAAAQAREHDWIEVRHSGPNGGYVAGPVAPAELETA